MRREGQGLKARLEGLDRRVVLGILCGLVAVVCMMVYASSVQQRAEESRSDALERYGGEQVEVQVAVRDLVAGQEIDAGDVEVRLWLADLLCDDVLGADDAVVGAMVAQTIRANEPISASRLGEVAPTWSVPEGKCAVSIPSKDVQAVGGAVVAGSVVDVFYVGDSGVTLFAEGLDVLETSNSQLTSEGSAAAETSTSRASLTWVTLAVDPDMVEELIEVSQTYEIHLVLPGEDVVLGMDGEVSEDATEE